MPVLIQYPTAGIRDHGFLSGLPDDDHGQYLMKVPTNTARNTVTSPTATITGLTVRTTDDSVTLPIISIQTSGSVSIFTVKAGGGTSITLTNSASVGLTVTGAASQSGSYVLVQNNSSAALMTLNASGQLYLANGTLSGTSQTVNFLNVTETLPSTITTANYAVRFNITSAGSSAAPQTSVRIDLNAGYTGTSFTGGLDARNSAAGTNTGWVSGNSGIYGQSSAVGAGHNTGIIGYAFSSTSQNIGVHGAANISGANVTNVGVLGTGFNSNATNPVQVGGAFVLLNGTYPTFTSVALYASNGSTTSPIFLAQDNSTTVFSIADGGASAITLTNSASVGLTITGAASQSGNYLTVRNSSSVVQWQITSAGKLNSLNQSSGVVLEIGASGTVTASWQADGRLRLGAVSTPTAVLDVINNNTTRIALMVQAASGQSVNTIEWRGAGSVVLGAISANGYFSTRKNSAPADAEIIAGEAMYWFDSTNGASKVKFKGKSADGTVVTGEVALA